MKPGSFKPTASSGAKPSASAAAMEKKDTAIDRKQGVKENSARDNSLDKKGK